jgi:hypothetical protein
MPIKPGFVRASAWQTLSIQVSLNTAAHGDKVPRSPRGAKRGQAMNGRFVRENIDEPMGN